ncbi:hypothetical protein IKX73_02760 [Candidatus Saccharibacteria bacterium]|nr:hypothetical protein [Candidatus Saccharibacteria bacterium]
MKNTKKTLTTLVASLSMMGLSVVNTATTHALNDICSSSAPHDVKEAAGCFSSGNLSNVVVNIINIVIGLLGIVAVIFIIVGGVTYMTSRGDAAKTKKAKDTILYACIGLVVCALAFVIVNFAINIINRAN